MDYQAKKISPLQHLVILAVALGGIWIAVKDFSLTREANANSTQADQIVISQPYEPITPIPLNLDLDPLKVELGEKLYQDPRLSHDNSISCASCHDLNKGGTDQVKYSTGINDALGGINSPTTYNSGFNFVQFWDGRAETLEAQAHGPVHNPVEMGSHWSEVIPKLKQVPYYRDSFVKLYPDGLTGDTIVDAIAVYERSLYTPNARFDQFLRGDRSALTKEEQEGYRLFKEYGCIGCHQGINIGGNMYQTLGVMDDYFVHRDVVEADLGRYNVTKRDWNLYQFKVPTLRNIALTFPYLHDGSAETLEDVLKVMWNSQLGRELREEEARLIVTFLKTLTGEYRGMKL